MFMLDWIKTLHHDVQATIAILGVVTIGIPFVIVAIMVANRILFGG